MQPIIAIASDHAGFELKETLKAELVKRGTQTQDFGTSTNKSCDYPDFAHAVSRAIATGEVGARQGSCRLSHAAIG
jgi:ribose 5-phosphate isomerase B